MSNDYRLLHSGAVSECYISGDNTRVCKQYHTYLAADRFLHQQILTELKLCSELQHPNILPIEEIECDANVIRVYMPWIRPVSPGELEEQELTAMLQDCAAALNYAHRLGHIHQSLHTGNIHRKSDGTFCISDFFSARNRDTCTITGTSFMTLNMDCIAPELLQSCRTDPRIDIFSLGKSVLKIWDKPETELKNPWLRKLLASMQGKASDRPASAARLLQFLHEQAAPEQNTGPCPFCGAEKIRQLRLCPHCKKIEPIPTYYDKADASALILSVTTEDSQQIDIIRSILSHFSGKPVSELELISGDIRKYSKAERQEYLPPELLLAAPISEVNADEIIKVFYNRIHRASISLLKHRYHAVKDSSKLRRQTSLFPLATNPRSDHEKRFLQNSEQFRHEQNSGIDHLDLALSEAARILRAFGEPADTYIRMLIQHISQAVDMIRTHRLWLQQPRLLDLYHRFEHTQAESLQHEFAELRRREQNCIQLEQAVLEQLHRLDSAVKNSKTHQSLQTLVSELGIQALL